MSKKLQWGIISTGRISGVFANGLRESKTGELLAVASRTQEAADRFGDEYKVPRRYGNYQALLDDPDVEAVYISTPHPMHAEWAVKAADAGKHVLCEKPLALNYPEATAVVEAARRNDVFLMEAFMYRCHPQTAKVVDLIKSGAVGEVKVVQATFSFQGYYNPKGRLFAPELAGGGIMDVGCYCCSMSRLVAGTALGKPFVDPIEVTGMAYVGETGVDYYAIGMLRFPNDILAQVSTGVLLNQENAVRIYGTEGSIYVPSPWFCPQHAEIVLNRAGKDPERIIIDTPHTSYTIEADIVARHIPDRQAPPPAVGWDDSLGNMRTLDSWRVAVGVTYPMEQLDADWPTVDRKPLAVRPRLPDGEQGEVILTEGNQAKRVSAGGVRVSPPMKYGSIEGVDKPVSRLIMGVMLSGAQFPLPHASVLYDEFFARGGNAFDTAYVYGGGLADRVLGRWIANRGIRDKVVVIVKGAHTPYCDPENLTKQLFESLERIGTDYADIYLLHRDNPEIPVGEFVDVLNEHHRAGRIRAFGGSNWSIERVEAANAYAKSKGLLGFVAVSNNFSLARMVEPVWAGGLSSSDAESRAWFEKTQIPLLAWSSLARGFFVLGDPAYTADQSLVTSWYCEDNFERLARAKEMAKKKGVEPVAIAMAYVLSQPFPTFALFGPASINEMNISMQGLGLTLTPEEMKWLNLES
ncbi:MAG: aldo/keto reductase [Armatimonadetes bacterium]|nr:aldo/keto reductase [Armatimonadota bacterium]